MCGLWAWTRGTSGMAPGALAGAAWAMDFRARSALRCLLRRSSRRKATTSATRASPPAALHAVQDSAGATERPWIGASREEEGGLAQEREEEVGWRS